MKLVFILIVMIATQPALAGKKKWFKCGTKYDATAQMPDPCGRAGGFVEFSRCYQMDEDEAADKKVGPAGARRDCGMACEKPLQKWRDTCSQQGEKKCPDFPGFTTVSAKTYKSDPSALRFVCRHEWCNTKRPFSSQAQCEAQLVSLEREDDPAYWPVHVRVSTGLPRTH